MLELAIESFGRENRWANQPSVTMLTRFKTIYDLVCKPEYIMRMHIECMCLHLKFTSVCVR